VAPSLQSNADSLQKSIDTLKHNLIHRNQEISKTIMSAQGVAPLLQNAIELENAIKANVLRKDNNRFEVHLITINQNMK
jgi:hypothetical protein